MRTRAFLIVAGCVLLLAPSVLGLRQEKETAPKEAPLTEDERILHLVNRFTPGATVDLIARVRDQGLKAWFEKQLKGDLPEPEELTSSLGGFESLNLSCAQLVETYDRKIPDGASKEEEREIRRREGIPSRELSASVLLRAVYGANPVRETSCDFFRNHFAVSIEKDLLRFLTMDWEREVIRRGALGKFGDLLASTARHPAMLIFLDNHVSRRPPTPSELKQIEGDVKRKTKSKDRAKEAVDIAKQRGLNENYARELLELHTLGVDNEYTQADVISVAKCLTGWTFRREGEQKFTFAYNPDMHSPEDKPFLGGTIQGTGTKKDCSEGDLVLNALTQHRGTALFLSWKLCRWLVNDEPDDKMVHRVATVFNKTGGDMVRVYRAIVEDPEFFSRRNFRAKFKRPWEFVVSALRATGARVSDASGALDALASMNEALYRCADPTGYYDQAEAWRDPGALATRWTFGVDLALGKLRGAKIPETFYKDLPADAPDRWKDLLVLKILPIGGLGDTTSSNINRLIEREMKRSPNAAPTVLGPKIVAMLLGSPEFQKQ